MGVEEVYNFLKKHKGFRSVKQIATALKLSIVSVTKSLNIITRYDDIVCEYVHLNSRPGIYKSNLKTKKAWVYTHANQIKKTRR